MWREQVEGKITLNTTILYSILLFYFFNLYPTKYPASPVKTFKEIGVQTVSAWLYPINTKKDIVSEIKGKWVPSKETMDPVLMNKKTDKVRKTSSPLLIKRKPNWAPNNQLITMSFLGVVACIIYYIYYF